MPSLKGTSRIAVVILGVALLAVSCGPADEDVTDTVADAPPPDEEIVADDEASPPGEVADAEPSEIRVGSIPIFNDADLFVAIEEGFFAEEDLTVELAPSPNFGANLAAVLSGENHFGFASSVPIITARARGAEIRLVAGAEVVPSGLTPEEAPDAVFAVDDEIASVTELEGRTVAVNALENINVLNVRNALALAGGNPDELTFIEMPYPDMIQAVQAERVDAVSLVEPFTSQARAAGLVEIEGAYWLDGLPEEALIDGYFASEELVNEQPELVTRFQRAMSAASDFSRDNLDRVRQIVPDYIGVDPEVADAVHFYEYRFDVSPQQIADLSELMVEHGFIDDVLDPDQLWHPLQD